MALLPPKGDERKSHRLPRAALTWVKCHPRRAFAAEQCRTWIFAIELQKVQQFRGVDLIQINVGGTIASQTATS